MVEMVQRAVLAPGDAWSGAGRLDRRLQPHRQPVPRGVRRRCRQDPSRLQRHRPRTSAPTTAPIAAACSGTASPRRPSCCSSAGWCRERGGPAHCRPRSEYHIALVGSGTVPSLPEGVTCLGPLERHELRDLPRRRSLRVSTVGEMLTLVMQEAMACGLPVVATDEPDYRRTGSVRTTSRSSRRTRPASRRPSRACSLIRRGWPASRPRRGGSPANASSGERTRPRSCR